MKEGKIIKYYKNNNELDLERIINEYSSYIAIIINNIASTNLSNEDKEEIIFADDHCITGNDCIYRN